MSQPPYQPIPPQPQPPYQAVPSQPQPGYQPAPGYPQQPQYPGYAAQPQSAPMQPAPIQYGSGQPGQAPFAGVPAPKKSRKGLWITLVVVLLVLCGGVGVGVYVVAKGVTDAVEPLVEATNIRLVTPDKLGDRPKITSSELDSAVKGMETAVSAQIPQATSSIAAFYGDMAAQDMVMVFGVSALLTNPEKELDAALEAMGAGGMKATNIQKVDPGSLGGVAKCGDSSVEGIDLAVCAWADNGSLGMVVFYFTEVGKAKSQFVGIREQVEIKQ